LDGIDFLKVRLLSEANAMTKVAILPVPNAVGSHSYRAVAGDKHSEGRTAGAALDALTAQFSEGEAGMLVIVQTLQPDRFFNAVQQQRLADLMGLWRKARDQGGALPADEQAELNALVEAEVRASADRAAALAVEAGR
jgi:hypothetical protein